MKKLKSEIREWIFNGLLELLFKFSNSHKLVKFNRLTKGDKIYYELSLRATIQTEGSLRDIEEKTSEYLKNLTLKNIELDEEQDEVRESKFNFMIPGWKNEGFWPKQAREKVEAFSVRNGYQTEEERVERLKKRSNISSSGLGIPCHINNQAKFPKLQKLENSSSEPGFNFLSTDLATTHQENPLLRKSEIKHVNFAEGEVRDKIIESYKDLQVKTMKRSIHENGYEILNEVKNGFIIARKDRHNIQPEGYLENLTKDLSESDKWMKEQLSVPDLSKQDLESLGVQDEEEITEEDWNKQLGSLVESKKQIIDTTNLPIKDSQGRDASNPFYQTGSVDKIPRMTKGKIIIPTQLIESSEKLIEDLETRKMQSFPTSQEGISKIPKSK